MADRVLAITRIHGLAGRREDLRELMRATDARVAAEPGCRMSRFAAALTSTPVPSGRRIRAAWISDRAGRIPEPEARASRLASRTVLSEHPPFATGRPRVRAAIQWARALHAGQRGRADRAEFVMHPLEVASLLSAHGYDDDVVAAGVLHDVLERTDATLAEINKRFGSAVGSIVAAVSDDPTIAGYAERKRALRRQVAGASPEARAVYAADKVANARELRLLAARDQSIGQRLEHYRKSLSLLRRADERHALTDELAFELWALGARSWA